MLSYLVAQPAPWFAGRGGGFEGSDVVPNAITQPLIELLNAEIVTK